MAAAVMPSGPLQEAAQELGRALLRAQAMSADDVLPPMKLAMQHLLAAAADHGKLQTLLEREKKQSQRVLEANDALSKRLLNLQMNSENLVRDLAPALEQITATFHQAIEHQNSLTSRRVPFVPTGSADQATAATLEAIRQSPIEAYGATR